MGEQLNDKFAATDAKINYDAEITAITVIALHTDHITQLNYELEDLQTEIIALEEKLGDDAYDTSFCGAEKSCDDCTAHETCIWCYDAGRCEPGDKDGSIDRQCVNYDFETCREERCSLYTTCDLCLYDDTCDWCQDGHICTHPENMTCSEAFLFTEAGHCPGNGRNEAEPPAAMSDTEIKASQQELLDLTAQARDLEKRIADTQTTIDAIEASTADLKAQTPPPISVPSNTEGTSEAAQLVAEKEMSQAKDVIEDAGERIQERFEDAREAQREELDTVRKYFASIDYDDFDDWQTIVDPEEDLSLDKDDFKSFLKLFATPEEDKDDD